MLSLGACPAPEERKRRVVQGISKDSARDVAKLVKQKFD